MANTSTITDTAHEELRRIKLRRMALNHPIRNHIITYGLTTVQQVQDALAMSKEDATRQITILTRAKLIS
ncbi:MAG: hypothetical protein WAU01_14685 [Saprospiraceae bacterium]